MSKASARNCSLPASPKRRIAVSFTIEKSTLASPGPRRRFRGAVPINPAGWIEKAQGSYQTVSGDPAGEEGERGCELPSGVPGAIAVLPAPQPALVPLVILLGFRP